MRLALFDLDNTLLTGDSDYEWGQFMCDQGVVERAAYEAQNRVYYGQYVDGTLDIHEYLGFALRPTSPVVRVLVGLVPRIAGKRWRIAIVGAPVVRTRLVGGSILVHCCGFLRRPTAFSPWRITR